MHGQVSSSRGRRSSPLPIITVWLGSEGGTAVDACGR